MKEDFTLKWKKKSLKYWKSFSFFSVCEEWNLSKSLAYRWFMRDYFETHYFSVVWRQSEFRNWDKIILIVISFVPSQALGLCWGSKCELGMQWELFLSFHQIQWQTWFMKTSSKFLEGIWTLVWSKAYSSRKQTKLHTCLTEILKWGSWKLEIDGARILELLVCSMNTCQ